MSDLVEALRLEGDRRVSEKEMTFGNSKSREDRIADDLCYQAASRISQQDAEIERMRRVEEALQQTVDFVVRQAWREDPPNANNKLTDSERLSAIKFYPRIKQRWESEQ
ncbi:hypothetical protein BTE77_06930 [Ensifer adhaerens]|nr:hypothetical protein BTE77_06930 [Ensifer adhaerens]